MTCRFASQPKWNGWSARKVTCHAGFGGKSRRQDSQGQRVSRKVDLARELEIRTVKSEEKKFVGRGAPTGPEWVRACNLTDLNSKPPMGRKACILDSTKILIVR